MGWRFIPSERQCTHIKRLEPVLKFWLTRISPSAKNFSVEPLLLQIKMIAHQGLTGPTFVSINIQGLSESPEYNLLQNQTPPNSPFFRTEALIPPDAENS